MTSTTSAGEFRISGVRIHAVQVDSALAIVRQWLEGERSFHYISSTNVNNVVIALESDRYFQVMERADLSLPDGVPFLWYGRLKGFPLRKRCGIEELMGAIFDLSNTGHSYSHFFYGNTPEVLGELKARLLQDYPSLNIVGMLSPPFRPLSAEEDEAHIKTINDSRADFLWVSLGCPKQEQWLYDHRDRLTAVAGGGAGAVFNFFSGQTYKAPDWVRYMGLEWLLRLLLEPRRLFRRYLLKYPKFLVLFVLDVLGIRNAR
jgi:N-acetylglucosaminyldiphosphoundecaprenol N-acetyl-beta-D-mannosaminyltransferase